MPDREQRTILLVDDEEMIVVSLRALLGMESPHHVLGLTSPKAALALIRHNPVDLVISDFIMPEMDGLSFLKEVRDVYPEAALIILTGYADKQSAIQAINAVGLFQYMEKPWNNEDLLRIVDDGLNRRLSIHRLQEYSRELEAKVQALEQQLAAVRKHV
jgi:DNA-binding NtrC family response regulator